MIIKVGDKIKVKPYHRDMCLDVMYREGQVGTVVLSPCNYGHTIRARFDTQSRYSYEGCLHAKDFQVLVRRNT